MPCTASDKLSIIRALSARVMPSVPATSALTVNTEGWMKPFRGVATEYLANGLGWRRMVDMKSPPLSAEVYLAAALG